MESNDSIKTPQQTELERAICDRILDTCSCRLNSTATIDVSGCLTLVLNGSKLVELTIEGSFVRPDAGTLPIKSDEAGSQTKDLPLEESLDDCEASAVSDSPVDKQRDLSNKLHSTYSDEKTTFTEHDNNEDEDIAGGDSGCDTGVKQRVLKISPSKPVRKRPHRPRKRHHAVLNTTHECSYCLESFSDIDSLQQHLLALHCQEDLVKPGNISSYVDNDRMLLPHKDDLTSEIQQDSEASNSIASEQFSSQTGLKSCKSKLGPKSFLCPECGKASSSAAALRRHLMRHNKKANKLMCDICSKTFSDKSSLTYHKQAIHAGVKQFKCNECDQSFNFANSLRLHKLKHRGVRPHSCNMCDKSYLTASHLKNHQEAVHLNKKQFQCPICSKTFSYENSLRTHTLTHTDEKPFMCSKCPKTFVTKQGLKAHETTHDASKNFECNICLKKYKSAILLKSHQRRHSAAGYRFMCDVCGSRFMYKSNLEAHYPVHGDTRDYVCNVCGKKFKTFPTLYSHQVVHSEVFAHKCDICSKSFKTKERLRAHQQRHSSAKLFQCSLCGNTFQDKGGLEKHKKTVHVTSMRYACPRCKKGCNRADNLRVHMKIHKEPDLLALPNEKLLADAPDSSLSDISCVKRRGRPRVAPNFVESAFHQATQDSNALELPSACSNNSAESAKDKGLLVPQAIISQETAQATVPVSYYIDSTMSKPAAVSDTCNPQRTPNTPDKASSPNDNFQQDSQQTFHPLFQ